MVEFPSDAELLATAARIQERLRHTTPSRNFVAGTIQHMINMIEEVVLEIRGEIPARYSRNRPRDLGSFLRSYDSILDTPEGHEVWEFFGTIAHRAEALDLPIWDPIAERAEEQ